MVDTNLKTARQRLSSWRGSLTFAQQAGGLHFSATTSRFGDGSLGEVFQQNHMADSTPAGIIASDAAITSSPALQFRCPLETMRTTLRCNARGNATGPLGDVALDMFAAGDEAA